MTRRPTTLYLAGQVFKLDWDAATSWRHVLAGRLRDIGYDVLDPLRGKESLKPNLASTDYRKTSTGIAADDAIVTRDLADILKRSDGLVVNVGPASATLTGTVCEVFAAAHIASPRLPVFAFTMPGDGPCPQVHSPWFGQFFTPRYHVHDGMEDLIDTLTDYFG